MQEHNLKLTLYGINRKRLRKALHGVVATLNTQPVQCIPPTLEWNDHTICAYMYFDSIPLSDLKMLIEKYGMQYSYAGRYSFTLHQSQGPLRAMEVMCHALEAGLEARNFHLSEEEIKKLGDAMQKIIERLGEAMKQHGSYDHDKHLPDNRMQPNDSGLNVWLQKQIIERLGNDQAQDLIEQAAPHKEERYAWMLDRMAERGHDDLVEEYHKRKLAIEAERRYRDKERQLKQWQDRLNETSDPQYAMYIRKQIVKCQEYLEKRGSQHDQNLL